MKANKIIALTTAFFVFLLAIGSFALSYSALQDVATQNGITGLLSYVWPLLIDFSLIVFSLAVVNAYLQSESTSRQWALVGVYTLATIGFNVAHAPNNLQAQIVAAIAPVSLFFSFELLMNQLKLTVQKHGLQLNVKQLTDQLYTKRKELDTRQNELDKMSVKLDEAKRKLDQLQSEISQAESVKNSSILHAQEAKFNSDVNSKKERLNTLVDILRVKPDEPVSNLADTLQVSRPTVYNDLNALEADGVICKNGNGWKVTK